MNDHLLFLLNLPSTPQHIVYICICMCIYICSYRTILILIHIVSYVTNEEIRRDVFSLQLSLFQVLISYLDKEMKHKLIDINSCVVTDTYRHI